MKTADSKDLFTEESWFSENGLKTNNCYKMLGDISIHIHELKLVCKEENIITCKSMFFGCEKLHVLFTN